MQCKQGRARELAVGTLDWKRDPSKRPRTTDPPMNRTDALAEKKRPGNVASFSKLGDQWRRMGDALESLVRISTPGPGNSLKKPGTVV